MAVNWQKEPPVAGDRRGAGRRDGRHACGHASRRRRAHAAQPEDRGVEVRLHGRGDARARRQISEHWHPFSEEFIYCVRGTLTADLDDEPREVERGRGALRPVHDAPPPPQRGRRGRVHRLPPRAPRSARRTSDTWTPSEAHRRSPASASSRPAASRATRSGSASPPGKTATRQITFFDPSGFRSQIAAEADFDPHRGRARASTRSRAWTATSSSRPPRRWRRSTTARSTSRQSTASAWAVSLGSAVGGTMALEDGYVAVSDRGQEWLVDPDYAPPVPLRGADPEQPGERDRAQVRRPRARRW